MNGCRGWLLGLLAVPLAFAGADLLGRGAGWGALAAGPRDRQAVALTFDDGPSERTEELLKLLDEHGALGTFFVTEPSCLKFPAELEILRRSEHELEGHGRWHVPALLMTPWREWQQIAWHPRPAGEAGPHFFRPPYGGHSPLTRVLARWLDRQVALWDVEGRDWLPEDAETLAPQALGRIRPGSVILLHDGPAVTPELLRIILEHLKARGLTAVRLADLPPQRITLRDGLRRLRQSYGG